MVRFDDVAVREVPAPLLIREVLVNDSGSTFWVDTFRAFSTGLSFASHYRWSAKDVAEDDPESWPDISGRAPGNAGVYFAVTADGEVWANDEQAPRALQLLGGTSRPQLATVRWWLPRLPNRDLAFEFRDTSGGVSGNASLSDVQAVAEALEQVLSLSAQ